MPHRNVANCHDGDGSIALVEVLGSEETKGRRLRFFHDDVLPPGSSIGVHAHDHDEEYYFVVSGRGTMILDGAHVPVSAGDITAVYPGGAHGLINDSPEDLRVLVLSVA
jgi:mannose-6-phosphate isomerase-like protein (cupin superfamily)